MSVSFSFSYMITYFTILYITSKLRLISISYRKGYDVILRTKTLDTMFFVLRVGITMPHHFHPVRLSVGLRPAPRDPAHKFIDANLAADFSHQPFFFISFLSLIHVLFIVIV